jgi:hypothetical protein
MALTNATLPILGTNTVVVIALRGKTSEPQMLIGQGGLDPSQLLGFDLHPSGQTWLWERVALVLDQLTTCDARILLLDLSGSMSSQVPMLKRMWAALPRQGLVCRGMEVMVVTDGQDNESEGQYRGSRGLVALLRHAMELGWDCGQPLASTLGKLHITLLDVGGGQVANELRDILIESNLIGATTLVGTQDPDLVARVVRAPRPTISGLVSAADLDKMVAPLSEEELEEIKRVEPFLGKASVNLEQLLNDALRDTPGDEAKLARSAVLDFLRQLLQGKARQVDKRGTHRTAHSVLNRVLYELEKAGVVQKIGTSPAVWSRNVMAAALDAQLE